MRVYNTWREVTLSTSLAETIIQNTTELTLMIKFGLTLPVDDENALYIAGRRKIEESIYNYDHTKDNMYVRILEDLSDCGNNFCRQYITVINDEPHYNGFEIHHGAGLMDFSILNATYVFWELADGSTSTLDNPSVTLPQGTSILYADFYKSDINLRNNATGANYVGDLKDLPLINYYLALNNCTNMTGDLKDLPSLSNYLNVSNCTNIIGILIPHPSLKSIFIYDTAMTSNDTDQTLKNIRRLTTITTGGVLFIKPNRTIKSDEAFNYLSANGWTITEL